MLTGSRKVDLSLPITDWRLPFHLSRFKLHDCTVIRFPAVPKLRDRRSSSPQNAPIISLSADVSQSTCQRVNESTIPPFHLSPLFRSSIFQCYNVNYR